MIEASEHSSGATTSPRPKLLGETVARMEIDIPEVNLSDADFSAEVTPAAARPGTARPRIEERTGPTARGRAMERPQTTQAKTSRPVAPNMTIPASVGAPRSIASPAPYPPRPCRCGAAAQMVRPLTEDAMSRAGFGLILVAVTMFYAAFVT